jgi:hypothetical protein
LSGPHDPDDDALCWNGWGRATGSSFSVLHPDLLSGRRAFGHCVAVPALCNGLCAGLCTEEDEARAKAESV